MDALRRHAGNACELVSTNATDIVILMLGAILVPGVYMHVIGLSFIASAVTTVLTIRAIFMSKQVPLPQHGCIVRIEEDPSGRWQDVCGATICGVTCYTARPAATRGNVVRQHLMNHATASRKSRSAAPPAHRCPAEDR